MTFQAIRPKDVADHKATGFIDIYLPIAGHKAIQYWWAPEFGGFWEPYQTGMCGYRTAKEAYIEAKAWAEAEQLPYVERKDLE